MSKPGVALGRLVALLLMLIALIVVTRLPAEVRAKTLCCTDCDRVVLICRAGCGSAVDCLADCDTQYEYCLDECMPEPCY
jgi:hypothetical protein